MRNTELAWRIARFVSDLKKTGYDVQPAWDAYNRHFGSRLQLDEFSALWAKIRPL